MADATLRNQILECVGGYVDPPGSPWPAVYAIEQQLEARTADTDIRNALLEIVKAHTDAGSFDRDDSAADHEQVLADRLVTVVSERNQDVGESGTVSSS